jgi:hypothetical protein
MSSTRFDFSGKVAVITGAANGIGTLGAFRTKPDGSLEPLSVVSGIPTSAAGLAGR